MKISKPKSNRIRLLPKWKPTLNIENKIEKNFYNENN